MYHQLSVVVIVFYFIFCFLPTTLFSSPITTHGGSHHCDKRYNETIGSYELHNNILDSANGFGTQCIEGSEKGSNGGIAWEAKWTWNEPNSFKAFPHIEYIIDQQYALKNIQHISFTWNWSYEIITMTNGDKYSNKDIQQPKGKENEEEFKANVAFELLTYSLQTGAVDYQIRIWLGIFGDDIDTLGEEVVDKTFNHDGAQWILYKGKNTKLTIYTLVPKERKNIISMFHGDALPYFNYLVENDYIPSNDPQGLFKLRAGSQVYAGKNMRFITHFFSVKI